MVVKLKGSLLILMDFFFSRIIIELPDMAFSISSIFGEWDGGREQSRVG